MPVQYCKTWLLQAFIWSGIPFSVQNRSSRPRARLFTVPLCSCCCCCFHPCCCATSVHAASKSATFKKTVQRSDRSLEFIPVNLHVQRLCVNSVRSSSLHEDRGAKCVPSMARSLDECAKPEGKSSWRSFAGRWRHSMGRSDVFCCCSAFSRLTSLILILFVHLAGSPGISQWVWYLNWSIVVPLTRVQGP